MFYIHRKHDKDDQNKAVPVSELKKMSKGTSMKSKFHSKIMLYP